MAELNKKLLQLLKSRKDLPFDASVVNEWYKARRYALRHLHEWEEARRKLKGGPLHIQITGADSQFPVILARQLSLLMHHPGFQEGNRSTRTVITLIYGKPKTVAELKEEVKRLSRDEYLCNLILFCDYTLHGTDGTKTNGKSLPYLDIEFELWGKESLPGHENAVTLPDGSVINDEVNDVKAEFCLNDMQLGMMVNNAYCLGATVDNLPNSDNATPMRYNIALDYLRGSKRKDREKEWNRPFTSDGGNIGQIDLRNRLSCIFSGDVFESHIRSVMNYYDGPLDYKYLLTHGVEIRRALCANLAALALAEHSRWNVEKLILGFRPFNDEERLNDELALQGRNAYRKKLKNRTEDPAHIDIMSYSELARINPQDMKYDHFIILAIPQILRKVLHHPED